MLGLCAWDMLQILIKCVLPNPLAYLEVLNFEIKIEINYFHSLSYYHQNIRLRCHDRKITKWDGSLEWLPEIFRGGKNVLR